MTFFRKPFLLYNSNLRLGIEPGNVMLREESHFSLSKDFHSNVDIFPLREIFFDGISKKGKMNHKCFELDQFDLHEESQFH